MAGSVAGAQKRLAARVGLDLESFRARVADGEKYCWRCRTLHPQHTFQVLTKRASRMREWFEWVDEQVEAEAAEWSGADFATSIHEARDELRLQFIDDAGTTALVGHRDVCHLGLTTNDAIRWPLQNVWLGVSVEDQQRADERIPELLRTPAAVRFLSCEPLLGPVDVTPWLRVSPLSRHRHAIDWIIAGCESGPNARPCDVSWLRSLRDQCAAAGVPYFLKQAVADHRDSPLSYRVNVGAGHRSHVKGRGHGGAVIELPYLDGVQHAAFPRST